MEAQVHTDKTFEKVQYTNQTVKKKEFERCIFKGCDWSYSNFSHNRFIDCTFEGCNLSMLKLGSTSLINAAFKDCKLLGLNFSECEDFLFSVKFSNCLLDMASFMNKKMPKTHFGSCSMKEVNFANAQLPQSLFDRCDLTGALFNGTQLNQADFATAMHYDIDPELNNIKKAKFSLYGIGGLLTKHDITIE